MAGPTAITRRPSRPSSGRWRRCRNSPASQRGMPRFVIRLDDVCPTMSWSAYRRASALFQELGVRPLLAVVPDNRDPSLMVDAPDPAFWAEMRARAAEGWTLAQHGYTHQYTTDHPGLLRLGKRSELAGLSYARQREMLADGQALLREQGCATDVFIAPSHSFDRETLRALRDLGFRYLSDGYGLYPFRRDGLVWVPQLFASGRHFGVGIYTICLHLNTMSERAWESFAAFLRRQQRRIIDFPSAARRRNPVLNAIAAPLVERLLRAGRS